MTAPPHDPHLEQHYTASVLAGYATDSTLDPDDIYTPNLRALAHAYHTLPPPPGRRYETTGDSRCVLYIPGLRDALTALGAHDPARLAGQGYALATDAAVSTTADVARLQALAATRRELAHLEDRRSQLLEAG